MTFDPADHDVLIGLAVAFGIGLLIGVEREQRKREDPAHIVAGVRTFALIALTGAISTLLGTALIVLAAAFVALGALASYQRSREADPGLTTEVAMFVAFLLGVLAMSQRELAAGIGVGADRVATAARPNRRCLACLQPAPTLALGGAGDGDQCARVCRATRARHTAWGAVVRIRWWLRLGHSDDWRDG